MSSVTAGTRGDGQSCDLFFLYSNVVSSPSMYFHFFMLYLLRPIFVRSLLRHFHSNQVPAAPLAKDSLAVRISWSGTYCRWLDHSLVRRVDGQSIVCQYHAWSYFQIPDSRCFFGTVWSCSGCLVSFTCPPSLFVPQHFSLL